MNYLLDKDFLRELDTSHNKELYARIVALDFDENQTEEIQGKITAGSVNVDGTSAVRRTCNLTIVAQDININDFYWSLNTKFKLYVGVKNDINKSYPDIVWFPQGLYLINTFSESVASNTHTISIGGKDKMCLLNGEVAGSVNALSWDFGTEDYTDEKGIVTNRKLLLKDIVRDAVHEYAKEPIGRIQVNDLDEAAVELMEYRGRDSLYMYIDSTDVCTQCSINGNQTIYIDNQQTTLNAIPNYNKCNELNWDSNMASTATKVTMAPNGEEYTVAKIDVYTTAGYRLTDLTYAGDLILSVGETITSLLDKIVAMLGDYEYFYDLYGNFVFQRKKTYVNVTFNSIIKDGDKVYAENANNISDVEYSFKDSLLLSSFQNSPNINTVKNDYSIWGKRTSANGQQLPVHIRYAIDKKPTYYKSLAGVEYKIENCDWREILYQMAIDYRMNYYNTENFLQLVQKNNGLLDNGKPRYLNGVTGYEQYYTDMEGFWRQLYCPEDDYKPVTLGAIEYRKAPSNTYFTRKLDRENYKYIYTDIRNTQKNYDPVTTYYERGTGWNPAIEDEPESINFWIDFLDLEKDASMAKYSVYAIGDRTKTLNDDNIKAIYFRETPKVIFYDATKDVEAIRKTGYSYINCPTYMEQLFNISAQGKSAIDVLNLELYNNTYCVESVSINTIPIYYLQPNTRIQVCDLKNGINGEYIINRMSYQLSHNGLMSINATKAPERLY